MNQLYYGDNLQVLREHIADESVDLIYLDPPFNSKRDYNLLFKSPRKGSKRETIAPGRVDRFMSRASDLQLVQRGTPETSSPHIREETAAAEEFSESQITAFEDTWHWGNQAEREFDELLHQPNTQVADMMRALRGFLGENDMMAYLTMMANRLLELHRVLKPTGSLYLHCDPTASHYLKIVLDGVFGPRRFINETIWKRTTAHNSGKMFGPVHDVILSYAKTPDYRWTSLRRPLDASYIESHYSRVDSEGRRYKHENITGAGVRHGETGKAWRGINPTIKGRHWVRTIAEMDKLDAAGRVYWPAKEGAWPYLIQYLDQNEGMGLQDVWDDISPINSQAKERLGYDTQKPVALLERILSASSDEGDVVLDPFCGCGTAVDAAQKLKRKWIGIDITHLAISLIEKRLKDRYGARCKFDVYGTPKDLEGARNLAERDKYQFQWWAVSLVEAQPFQGKKKGADTGIDGVKFFRDLDRKEVRKMVVSVKGGGIKPDDVRALNHVREREKAEIALFISLDQPTPAMVKDAASVGFYESKAGKKFARVQLLTIDGLLNGTQRAEHPDYEPDLNFKKAKAETTDEQQSLI